MKASPEGRRTGLSLKSLIPANPSSKKTLQTAFRRFSPAIFRNMAVLLQGVSRRGYCSHVPPKIKNEPVTKRRDSPLKRAIRHDFPPLRKRMGKTGNFPSSLSSLGIRSSVQAAPKAGYRIMPASAERKITDNMLSFFLYNTQTEKNRIGNISGRRANAPSYFL